jgi:ubiquitin-conjugating enzyme E2 W
MATTCSKSTMMRLILLLQLFSLLVVIKAVSQQQMAFVVSDRLGFRSQCTSPSSLAWNEKNALLLVRGGEVELSEEEDDDGDLILSKLRNIVRNLLSFGDKKVPTVSKLLRSLLRPIEKMTGMRLLPKSKSKKSKSKTSKNKNNNPQSIKSTNEVKSSTKKKVAEANDDDDDDYEKTPKIKKTSAATKKHLSASIKSANPNYRVQRELKEFLKSPPSNLSVQVGSNIRVWIVTMEGAKNTVYEGEVFKLRMSFPAQYPTVPPSVYFLQGRVPIHEHVYTNGDICLSLLGKDWRPTMTAQSIAVSILSILSSAQSKSLPMDNARHAGNKPGEYQKDWVYHDDNC